MVWHVRLGSSTLLQAKNVVATWCGLHKVRTWAAVATRTTIVVDCGIARGLSLPPPALSYLA